jgi:hypothetical protein
MIDTTAAATWMTTNKGNEIEIEFNNDTIVTGTAVSMNSKGVNIRVEDKVRSFALARIVGLVCEDALPGFTSLMDDELTADDIADGEAEIDADDNWIHPDTEADYIADMKESGEVDLTDIDTSATFTTAEVAARFAMTAKELRVQLRAWGMGVGQGRTYAFDAADLVTIQTKLAEKAEQA